MAWKLRSDMQLEPRPARGYVALRRKDAAEADPLVFPLHPYHGMAMALFDGRRTTDDVIDIIDGVIDRSRESAGHLVEVLLRRYRQFFVDVDPADANGVNGANGSNGAAAVDPAACIFPSSYNFRQLREAAPSALLWVVTEFCDKKCRYCFMNAIYTDSLERPPDIGLPYERVCQLIEEAAAIGVNKVILSGGEPFLRPDLIEIIAKLVEHHIEVVPITKHRITGDRMRRLAATGLRDLHVSLDSPNPAMVADLTGVPSAFDDMIETIRGAVAHGIDVTLRPTLTNQNARDFEGIIALGLELGVKDILIGKYGDACGRHEDELSLDSESKRFLKNTWPVIKARYRDAPMKIEFDEAAGHGRRDEGCVEGLRGLTLLPNGVATKCEHWRFDDQLVFGDLRRQSLLEVWHSDRLRAINFPEREAYAGTICYHCKNLSHCDYVRGRCSMSALKEYGTPYGPDIHCPIGAFERHLPGEPERPPSPLLQIRGLKKAKLMRPPAAAAATATATATATTDVAGGAA
jgi:radical SAM protein with 4Fe4S-binding SPASM domain